DDLEGIPQSSTPAPADEPAPDQVGLVSDEAAALIDAKAKQAAEQAQRAAKAGLAAASRAAVAMKAQGEKLRAKVQGKAESRKRPRVIGMTAGVLVVGGAIGWWVWSQDADHRETQQPVAPVMVIPAGGGTVEPQAAEPQHEPAPVEVEQAPAAKQAEPMPTMPVIPPVGGGFVQQQPVAAPPPAQDRRADASQVPTAAVLEAPAPEQGTTPKAASTPKPTTSSPVVRRTPPAKRIASGAASPNSEIGSREKQQIDQIHA